MIINDLYRFLFVHIPKTGGTSVTKYLSQWDGGEAADELKHASLDEIAQLYVLDGHTIFTVVRHPVSRVRSTFAFLRQYMYHADERIQVLGLEDFVMSGIIIDGGPLGLLRPQVEFIDSRIPTEHIIQTDSLSRDIEPMAMRIGLPVTDDIKPIKHMNRGLFDEAVDWSISDEAIERILERYHDDMVLYTSRGT